MAIKLFDVEFTFEGAEIIRRSSVCFDEGLIHLVVGRTGSGKSTLSYLISGLAKPTGGKVAVDGMAPDSKDFDRQLLQLAFQFPEEQIFASSVEEEIGFGPRNFGLQGSEVEDRINWATKMVGLGSDFLKRSPLELSFGERRKVALASVIAVKPRYLLLDEPFAGLDCDARKDLLSGIKDLNRDGMTLIIFTHEVDVVGEIGDRIIPIEDGRITGSYRSQDFFDKIEDECLLPDHILVARNLIRRGWEMEPSLRSVDQVANWIIDRLAGNRVR
ncbi:MAG: energy-coupling factor ABC transporter ATP-binding protein [bacterium]